MAIVIMDGFDLYGDLAGLQGTWSTTGTPTFSPTSGRFGGGGVTIDGGDDENIWKLLPDDSHNYLTAGFALKSDLSAASRVFVWGDDSGAATNSNFCHGAVLLNSDGSFTLEGDGGADIATSATGSIVAGSWNYIEVQIFRDAAGTIELFVNGSSVASGSGDTLGNINGGIALVGNANNLSPASNVFDDVYVSTDPTALPATKGDVVIETLLPNADTAQADWTLSTGTDGFALIDDALGTNGDGDTTYISATTLGNKSEFDLQNLSASPSSIHAVAIRTRASKTDAGTIEYTQYIDSSGIESAGTAIAPAESVYTLAASDLYETDPNTAAAWTEAGVNALKIGVEITG